MLLQINNQFFTVSGQAKSDLDLEFFKKPIDFLPSQRSGLFKN